MRTGRAYLKGLALSASGMLVISPDSLLLRLVGAADVWQVIFWRSLFMGLGLAAALPLYHRRRTIALVREMGRAGLTSALLVAAGNLSFVGAIAHTSVANTLVIIATMPLFGAVLGRMLIAEAVRPSTWAAIAAAIGGIVLIFAQSVGGGTWLGDGLALLTAMLMALNLVLLRRFPRLDVTSVLCLAGFLGAAAAFAVGGGEPLDARQILLLAGLGGVLIPLSLALFFAGTRSVPAAEVALLSLIETVLGPLWVWLGVGEAPPAATFAGGAVVLGAIAVNAALGARAAAGSAPPRHPRLTDPGGDAV